MYDLDTDKAARSLAPEGARSPLSALLDEAPDPVSALAVFVIVSRVLTRVFGKKWPGRQEKIFGVVGCPANPSNKYFLLSICWQHFPQTCQTDV